MIAVMLAFLLFSSQLNEEEMALKIQQNITTAAAQISTSFDEVDTQRGVLPTISDIDYFVFAENGELIIWTSNDFVPTLSVVTDNLNKAVLINADGEFIFKSKSVDWKGKSAVLVGMTMVRRTYALTNQFLEDRYNEKLISGNVQISTDPNSIPVRYNGETLFYIKCTGESYYNHNVNVLITVLLVLFLVGVLRVVYYITIQLRNTQSTRFAALVLFIALVAIRVVILVVDLPSAFGKMSVFVPETFTYNWFYPTLGDGIINLLLINMFLIFLLFSGRKSYQLKGTVKPALFAGVLIIGSYLALYLFADSIQLFQRYDNLSLDIANSLVFTVDRIAAFVLIILLALLFFLVHYLAYRFMDRQIPKNETVWMLHCLAIICILILAIFNDIFWVALVVNIIYIMGIYYFDMPDQLSSFRFSSINYLLFTCITLALVGSIMIYKGFEKQERFSMQRFASFLHLDRDIEGEYLLSDILDQIQLDPEVIDKMDESALDQEAVTNRIERVYLKNYFNDYEVGIYFFDVNGRGLSSRFKGQPLTSVMAFYQNEKFKTAYDNIFFDGRTDSNKRKKYICYLPVGKADSLRGYLEIELILKKFSSKRVLPQLLWDRGVMKNDAYDYAFLVDGQFDFTSGNFEYESAFDMKWLALTELYHDGVEKNGYHHLATEVDNRITIVSHKLYADADVLSNFSFLFIVLLFVICLAITIIALMDKRFKGDLNFSTKIMMYSIASFVLPLLLVATAVLTTTVESNKEEIDKSNLNQTFLIAENIDGLLNEYHLNNITVVQLENQVNELAVHASQDLNVYDAKGVLLSSSTPEIFEKEILSPFVNPKVLNVMTQQGKESAIMSESIGSFQYKASYVSINSPHTGQLLGILGSPYFGSKNHVTRQQLQIFGNIINIFTFIFIASIWVAYWVVSKLTSPIVEIAAKLHETGFLETNQPIDWKTDDEIGKLVSEYNNMLSKLEATKLELARNEKEAAWREMAKQVAHEIKNPLTPMKLTIQHLSRVLAGKLDNNKSLDLLLGQIDTLDDIVTSFSHFAQMPTPENKPFDISQVLQRSIDLHVDKEILLEMTTESCVVFGDIKLFGRIFNNLILNAFESMKKSQRIKLDVKLVVENQEVLISFQDQGEGIGADIRDKIFIPNFSTKDAGSGIGLAVAKRGIEHAGGDIWFESVVGEGSIFYIKLPLFEDAEIAVQA